ncbi:hypothetical protein [Microscilla marina]|uniref:Uncharacterized protein n=1 Tax=Microscilla marina ATCC 23134 TaxID=313606 RepID=A1ZSV9_MICM2|nr:hypothetical protein [Microscilla marina]EAY26523.1 hypothetical protein M23134_01693 [Microscilla marina ATCC 23134]
MNKQEAIVKQETQKGAAYAKAAQVIKKGIALRKKLDKLHIERNQLLDLVQGTEKRIQKLRLELLRKRGGKASLEREIHELTATKNQQQALVVQKDLDIAHIEQALAKFAKEENAYTLNIKKTIDANDLQDEAKVVQMLQQNVAPKDLEQLKRFIEVQAKQVQSQKDQGLHADQQFKIKEKEAKDLIEIKIPLAKEQELLNKQLAQLQSNKPLPKGKRGQKKKTKGGQNRKDQSKKDRRKNINKRLKELEPELATVQNKLDAAINAQNGLKAKKIEATAKHTQEEAKLKVYQEFYKLQKNIAAGKQNIANTRQEFHRLKGELSAASRELKQTDAAITHYRAPIKQSLNEQVTKLNELEQLAKKEYDGFYRSYGRVKKAHTQAQQHYDMLQRVSKEEYALSVAEAKRAKKIVNLIDVLITSGKAILKQSAGINPPVFKAWWKVNKILRKLLNPSKGKAVKDLTQQEAYAIAEQKKLENFLKNYVSNSDTLPNDEASLWQLLFKVLEGTGKSHYTGNKWSDLLDALVSIKKENASIQVLQTNIAQLNAKISAFPVISLSGELSLSEAELLDKMDDIIAENEKNKTSKASKKQKQTLSPKEIQEIMDFMNKNAKPKEN